MRSGPEQKWKRDRTERARRTDDGAPGTEPHRHGRGLSLRPLGSLARLEPAGQAFPAACAVALVLAEDGAAFEEVGNDVAQGIDQPQGQVGLDLGGDIDQVFFVVPRQKHDLDARPAGGQDFLANAADRQHAARSGSPRRSWRGWARSAVFRKKLIRAAVMATPADGPSLGTAPAGTWMCRSVLPNREASRSRALAWLRR